MTMIDDRPGAFDRDPSEVRPHEMSPAELEAAGYRWMTRAESDAWAQRVANGFTDEASVNRDMLRILPLARQRLAGAIATLEDLQHELRTKTRLIRHPRGQVAYLPSPFFVDGQGRDEPYWRAQAAEAKAEVAKMLKAGPATDEATLEALCQLRLTEASASNTASRVAFNSVLLRRAVGKARENVRTRQAELADLTRRTAPYMDAA